MSYNIAYSKLITPPAVEPIQLEDLAKLDLKIDDQTDEDDLLEILIKAVREITENRLGKALITQTREIKLDYFPCDVCIYLSYGPVQADSVVITYYDSDEVLQTLDPSAYWVDTHSEIARVIVKNSWPSTKCMPNAVSIVYDCGYGDTPEDVPATLRKAMLLLLGHLYENRQQVTSNTAVELPFGFETLVSTFVTTQNVSY